MTNWEERFKEKDWLMDIKRFIAQEKEKSFQEGKKEGYVEFFQAMDKKFEDFTITSAAGEILQSLTQEEETKE